jgi:hypothetical protein
MAIHSWTYLGARDDFEIVLTTTDRGVSSTLVELLPDASDAGGAPTGVAAPLDEQHYADWTDARATHIDRTRAHVESQLASLTTTHQARVKLLEDQIMSASHDNIRRMRESELHSLAQDFDARRRRLEESIQRSDITASLLYTGTVEVVSG